MNGPRATEEGGPDPLVTQVLEQLRRGVADDDQVRSLVQGGAQSMLILDDAGRIFANNPRAAAFFNREPADLEGRVFASLLAPAERSSVSERIERGLRTGQGAEDVETELEAEAGPIHVVITFLPFRTRTHSRIALLLRERAEAGALDAQVQRLTRELAHNKKLTELGELLSGVAHELKSPVTYIENLSVLMERNLAEFARTHPADAVAIERLRADAAQMREGARRVRRILAELHPLARNQPTSRIPVDLAQLAQDAVRTFQGSSSATTEIVLDLQSTHPVRVDKREINRVVVNLLRNASEAMNDAGRIVVRTRNRDCPPRIVVEDEGPGVSPALEARLFEPFFTTKSEGTGLGLVISRRIVESNGGSLRYQRRAEGGAAFVIEFERAADS